MSAPPDTSATEKRDVSGAPVSLGGRVEIYPSTPLPDFNCAGGPAFAARIKGDNASDLMAVICNGNMPPRFDFISSMRGVRHASVLDLVEHGVAAWPDGMNYGTLVYQRPGAPRLRRSLDEICAPMSEDALNRYFVAPLAGALSDFMRMGIFHGSIRPTNIFWREGSATPPLLGECLSAPAGIGQPALLETIERGMAVPAGRGNGLHADDCYAFGMTVALMILGHNPLAGLDDRAIIQMKLERGTFNSLIGNHRLGGTHIELLRGLLTDDIHQRWTAADLEQWLTGRRLTPKGSDTGRRASRHFDFAGQEFWQIRPLSDMMMKHVGEATRLIENGTLDKWLRRSFGDEDKANDVDEARKSLKEGSRTPNYEEQLVARTCIALYPTAPIRYRGLSVMPAGIANMLTEAVATGGNVQVMLEIVASQLVSFWVDRQDNKTDYLAIAQQFERLAGIIERGAYGNGIERGIYELNPTIPCLSPMVRAQYVTTPKGILLALEKVASSPLRGRDPMDRHIAAFLIVRDRKSELLMESMSAPEQSAKRGIALLTLFADMQNRHGPDGLPGLAQWILPSLEPASRRFFGKGLREGVQRHLKEAAERGHLHAMLQIVNNPQTLRRDEEEFVAARLLYLNIMKEINALEGRLANRDAVLRDSGKPIAATVSSFLSLMAVIGIVARAVLMHF